MIKQSFVNVHVRSGLAAMGTLGLGLKSVLLNSKGRCPYYQGRVYLWRGAAGCSSSGEEGVVMAGPASSLPFAVTLRAVTRAGRSPGSLCPPANALHFFSEEGEAWRKE